MTELPPGGASATHSPSAGALLRAARERSGIHIAVLAATIKVAPGKLEALEADRFDELPNASFARALAQSVCRSLKIDARPVLAALPPPDTNLLGKPVGPLNTPFRERPGRGEPTLSVGINTVGLLLGGTLLVAAVALVLAPQSWFDDLKGRFSSAPDQSGSGGAPVPSALPEIVARVVDAASETISSAGSKASDADLGSRPVAVSPTPGTRASADPGTSVLALPAQAATSPAAVPASVAASSGPLLRLRARAASWVEVVDAAGQVLISRTLSADESVDFSGPAPLKVKVGNAAVTEVSLRGNPVDLAAYTRDNIARLELR